MDYELRGDPAAIARFKAMANWGNDPLSLESNTKETPPLIKLTSPDGNPVWVLRSWVQIVRHPTKSEYRGLEVGTVLVLSGINQAVREKPSEVVTLLAFDGRIEPTE